MSPIYLDEKAINSLVNQGIDTKDACLRLFQSGKVERNIPKRVKQVDYNTQNSIKKVRGDTILVQTLTGREATLALLVDEHEAYKSKNVELERKLITYKEKAEQEIKQLKKLWWDAELDRIQRGMWRNGRPTKGEYRFCVDCGEPIYIRRYRLEKHPNWGKRCKACMIKTAKPPKPRWRFGKRIKQNQLKFTQTNPLLRSDIAKPMGCKFCKSCRDCKKIFDDDCKLTHS